MYSLYYSLTGRIESTPPPIKTFCDFYWKSLNLTIPWYIFAQLIFLGNQKIFWIANQRSCLINIPLSVWLSRWIKRNSLFGYHVLFKVSDLVFCQIQSKQKFYWTNILTNFKSLLFGFSYFWCHNRIRNCYKLCIM